MKNAFDTAHALLQRTGAIDTARLHKLLYYVQAWSLAKRGKPAFDSAIKAWSNGPVVPDVHARLKGLRSVGRSFFGSVDPISSDLQTIVDFVVETYGPRSTDFLIELTHFESPWQEARDAAPGNKSPTIGESSMCRYFSGKTPEAIEADYHLHVARGVANDFSDALRRLAQ